MSHHNPQLRRRKIRGDKRTIPLKGYGEDRDKYFRCWHCGFVCDIDRDELAGDEASGSGVSHKDHEIASHGAEGDGEPRRAMSRLLGFSSHRVGSVTLELDANSDPKAILHSFVPTVIGCPFCGTLNYK